MANLCSYELKAKGKKRVLKALAKVVSDRSYFADVYAEYSPKDKSIIIRGSCKWSVQNALFGANYSGKSVKGFVEENKLSAEIYSTEPGCCFAEHYLFDNGELSEEESVEYYEDYDEETGDFIERGGFGKYEWAI